MAAQARQAACATDDGTAIAEIENRRLGRYLKASSHALPGIRNRLRRYSRSRRPGRRLNAGGATRLPLWERQLSLVTGRELPDLQSTFPRLDQFDRIVAENGALLYRPATKEERVLAEPPPPAFLEELEQRGVRPVSTGRVIVATWEPHQAAVLDAIRHLGLELQVIFNKGAVMVLPSGVNKATGLAVAAG